MNYLKFNKEQLINLSYSLTHELLRTNRSGSFASTSLIGCNTRKYHGLLITPQSLIDNEMHVLVSSIDPTIIQQDTEFHLGIHQYPNGVFAPKGHKYARKMVIDSIPKTTYRVGGVIFTQERLFISNADRILTRYTIVDCHSPVKLRLQPFLAFRQRHHLSKANNFVDKSYKKSKNGVQFKMYQGYTPVHFQFSKKVEYVHAPDWYYNIEYSEEKRRGYDYLEDLYVPGYFEMTLKKGESIILSAGTEEINPTGLKRMFATEAKRRIHRQNFKNNLINAAEQFVQKRNKKTQIVAGYPWFGVWGRDTFIALPGLSLSIDKPELAKQVLDSISKNLKDGLFPNIGENDSAAFNSIDAPLWYFWSIQQYVAKTNDYRLAWKQYGKKMLSILNSYKNGIDYNIKMQENALISGGVPGKALTWMDAIAEGKAVTPRIGMPVEINALWYNALRFFIELAQKAKARTPLEEWQAIANKIPQSFTETFWDERKGYLADFVCNGKANWDIRPNMIFAASLAYSPIKDSIKAAVVKTVKKELLTTRGLRTLSPKNPQYKGIYEGDQNTRDRAYHQGTVWPWLFGHFAEAYLKIRGEKGIAKIEWYLEQFEETLIEHGIGSISEIFDGNPPHTPRGSISQAWSVSEVLRVIDLIESIKNKK